MKELLVTENLTKDFGGGKGAIDISIDIHAGEIVGFIGPNGAGKTTTLNMIAHLITPESGNFRLFGKPVTQEADFLEVSRQLGFLPSEGGLYESMTARQLLGYAAGLYQTSPSHITKLADEFKLDLDIKIRNLSLGNKRKVGIIQALVHNPKLLILDEPTSGLDPLMQKQVLDLIRAVRKRGGAVFLSSHNLAEVESVCDRVIMIKDAKIIFSGKTSAVLEKALKRFRIENSTAEIFKQVQKLKSVKKAEFVADDVIAYVEDPKPMLEFLRSKDIYNFYLERPSLEEAFADYY